jgi:hypothetical protein
MHAMNTRPEVDLTRFRQFFPLASRVIENVWLLLPIFMLAALILSVFSVHYGLSMMCLWMGLLCFWVDRKHLNYLLFTPLQPLATLLIMTLGAGISMLVYDSPEKYQLGFLAMQLAGLLGFPFMMVGYYFVTRKVPGFVFPSVDSREGKLVTRPLVLVGWFCLFHELAKVVSGIASGTMDRGMAGDFQVDTPFGWWTAFGIFLRIQTMGFLLVPLIWRENRIIGRVLVAVVVSAILFLHFVAASRGAVFFPLFILLGACYLFLNLKGVKYELLFLFGIIGLAPLVTIMGHYRSSQAFRETDIRNVFQKLGTITEGLERQKATAEDSGERFSEAGRSFLGVADPLVYEMTPGIVPHGGFERMDGMLWTFVPYILSQGRRPVMQDGNLIVANYRGYTMSRTSIGISYPAELYRRWGWWAVPMGLLFYGLFYGAVFRFVYTLYLRKNALWGFMLCGLLFHFFIAWFFHTVLNMFWYWFYDIPKHVALLAVLYWGLKTVFGIKAPPGALALMSSAKEKKSILKSAASRAVLVRAMHGRNSC